MIYNSSDVMVLTSDNYFNNEIDNLVNIKKGSYITENKGNTVELSTGSYIDDTDNDFADFVPNSYVMKITKGLDIFSELPKEVFSQTSNKQMAKVMNAFLGYYSSFVSNSISMSSLPKFKMYKDDDNANIIQFISKRAQGDISVYFSFEEDARESSYGMVFNDYEKKEFISKSGLICNQNLEKLVQEVYALIISCY